MLVCSLDIRTDERYLLFCHKKGNNLVLIISLPLWHPWSNLINTKPRVWNDPLTFWWTPYWYLSIVFAGRIYYWGTFDIPVLPVKFPKLFCTYESDYLYNGVLILDWCRKEESRPVHHPTTIPLYGMKNGDEFVGWWEVNPGVVAMGCHPPTVLGDS